MQTTTTHSYRLGDDLIARIADQVETYAGEKGDDLSRIAIVFPGDRPHHFLNRELSRRRSKSFFPPRYFTIDSFCDSILLEQNSFSKLSDMNAAYLLFKIVQECAPKVMPDYSFSTFMPWGQELLELIDQLDLDGINNDMLRQISETAELGYDLPQTINDLLVHITTIRERFHEILEKRSLYSRGYRYLRAAQFIKEVPFDEYDEIYFCGFFFLHTAEKEIIKTLYTKGKARLFFQGEQSEWRSLNDIAEYFNIEIKSEEKPAEYAEPQFALSAAFDIHSQTIMVHEALKAIPPEEHKETVLVVPNPDAIIPLLSEIAVDEKDYNVSMGYPLMRSSLYSLCELIFKAQETRKDGAYYSRDYLHVLRHPIIKNLTIIQDKSVTRLIIHKIEEVLLGMEKTPLGGSLFIELDSIESLDEVHTIIHDHLCATGFEEIDAEMIKKIIAIIHASAFRTWEPVRSFEDFAERMESFIDVLVKYEVFKREYPLNINIVERMLRLIDEIRVSEYRDERFEQAEIFSLFLQSLRGERIAFKGTPLRGLQILGRLETRSLRFKNVIMMDVNEGVFPQSRNKASLIPPDIMRVIGLKRMDYADEIERYQFMRLYRASENTIFVYSTGEDTERSRFLEELLWTKQKEDGKLTGFGVKRGAYKVNISEKNMVVEKKTYLIDFLRNNFVYSASSLNTYLECPLKFYYQYALRLKEKEDFLEEPEGADIGTFIHELLEEQFGQFIDTKPHFDKKFADGFFKNFNERFDATFLRQMGADSFTIREVMHYRLQQFLEFEETRTIDRVLGLEKEFTGDIALGSNTITCTAKIDRIDRMQDGSLLILDYKTGGVVYTPVSAAKMGNVDYQDRVSIKKGIRSFQLPLYLYFVQKEYPKTACDAALYHLRTLEMTYFSKKVEEYPFERSHTYTMRALEFIVSEILDPAVPFEADTTQAKSCSYCPFKGFCS